MQGPSGQALAESVVLRGARRGGAPLQSHQVSDLLDQSLLLEGVAMMNIQMVCIYGCLCKDTSTTGH